MSAYDPKRSWLNCSSGLCAVVAVVVLQRTRKPCLDVGHFRVGSAQQDGSPAATL